MSHTDPLRSALLLLSLAGVASCASDAPTGVDIADLRGTWSGTFSNTPLLGRTLTGDIDWIFEDSRFQIVFFSEAAGQPQRMEGDWKFSSQKVVLTLRSSFPIDTDIGARDTLFVSILRDEMSIKTVGAAQILLRKTRAASVGGPRPSTFLSVVNCPAITPASFRDLRCLLATRRPPVPSAPSPVPRADLRPSLRPPV